MFNPRIAEVGLKALVYLLRMGKPGDPAKNKPFYEEVLEKRTSSSAARCVALKGLSRIADARDKYLPAAKAALLDGPLKEKLAALEFFEHQTPLEDEAVTAYALGMVTIPSEEVGEAVFGYLMSIKKFDEAFVLAQKLARHPVLIQREWVIGRISKIHDPRFRKLLEEMTHDVSPRVAQTAQMAYR